MGNLATYLQQEFHAKVPLGWASRHEVRLLSTNLERLLGYSPRVDVVLEREDGTRRLWIEFEVSRADPVANHAKFATSQLFQPQAKTEAFLSMVSPHIARGRRNLAANTIWVMRHIGMEAYQTILLPHTKPKDIQRLNHLMLEDIMKENIDVESEVSRALTVSQSLTGTTILNIHFVANIMEVMLNINQWNRDLETDTGQQLWGKRTITYFVYDPRLQQFAPSKFCAYVSIPKVTSRMTPILGSTMTVRNYRQVESTEPIFDGQRARHHLTRNLAMVSVKSCEDARLSTIFNLWISKYQDFVNVHPAGPIFIFPPNWF